MKLISRTVAAVALLAGAAVAPSLVAAPAHAAACSGASGTSVIVDFAELGGGVTAGCAGVADGTRANVALQQAGYGLTMATRSPGFLCRVNGVPASDPCVDAAPADAYWSVWWADGDGGDWVYSARGIDSLRVIDGGYLALSWHQGSGRSQPPATVPVSREVKAEPSPTKSPTKKPAATPSTSSTPSTGNGSKNGSQSGSAQGSGTPGARPSSGSTPSTTTDVAPQDPTVQPSPDAVATPTDTPSPGESVAVDPELPSAADITAGPETVAAEPAGSDDAGLPVWAPVLVVLAVLGGGIGFAVTRRRGA